MDEKRAGYSYFQNRACEFFPCHEVREGSFFNCLFCYCPLYALGEHCGGAPRYTGEGVKDCSACVIPHAPGGYDFVIKHLPRLIKMACHCKSAVDAGEAAAVRSDGIPGKSHPKEP